MWGYIPQLPTIERKLVLERIYNHFSLPWLGGRLYRWWREDRALMLLLILFLFQFFIFAIFPNRLILTYMDIDMLKGSLTCQQIGSCMAAACVDASRGHEHSTATSCRYFCVFFSIWKSIHTELWISMTNDTQTTKTQKTESFILVYKQKPCFHKPQTFLTIRLYNDT